VGNKRPRLHARRRGLWEKPYEHEYKKKARVCGETRGGDTQGATMLTGGSRKVSSQHKIKLRIQRCEGRKSTTGGKEETLNKQKHI
jgi:hypothetical protein